jgi:ribosomal protein S18 acetylase RimI-like enzyme
MRIRPAVPNDADGIARVFLESAEHHAALDPERYFVPEAASVSHRYRMGSQHPSRSAGEVTTLVADSGGVIVGFVDARLERPSDAMHRDTIYCYVAEIAVNAQHRSRGVGERLLRAAEEWGRKLGAEFASLEYNAANTRAAEFYQGRMGYRVASLTAVKRLRPAQLRDQGAFRTMR